MQEETLSIALRLLRQAGVQISGGNLKDLSLTLPDGSTRVVNVKVASIPPTPSMTAGYLERQEGREHYLVITHRPSRHVTAAAARDALDMIAVEPPSVMIGGRELLLGGTEPAAPKPTPSQGKPAWGRYALLRSLLLSTEPQIQRVLAHEAGISQPAVTKNLKLFDTWVAKNESGWFARDKTQLLDYLLKLYPGPRGATSYWYSLRSLDEQLREAIQYAEEMGAKPLVSGDVAADIYAPWRLPDRATIYLREFVDFNDAGFSPASRDEATLIAVTPEDLTLWLTASVAEHEGLPLADPLLTLWDLTQNEAPDAPDAVKHLRDAILSGAAH
ncbi:hypothetical protein OOZ51_14275 [Arthrobacter sp. MI7-26]|uniref:hypothetical protein n=1 Tax=Arthrobacter sp. MI7-26 TaxID=2993653 RepID=UPI0022495459|nr:hypothetical protein [Arthrobacter sp. MI7-26]MCX2748971.1 hypothetical protein [Arthrobacter sp. MI7-26]